MVDFNALNNFFPLYLSIFQHENLCKAKVLRFWVEPNYYEVTQIFKTIMYTYVTLVSQMALLEALPLNRKHEYSMALKLQAGICRILP